MHAQNLSEPDRPAAAASLRRLLAQLSPKADNPEDAEFLRALLVLGGALFTLTLLAYLAFVLPLFGPLSRWTHIQLSVPAIAALLWVLWRTSRTPGHKLASDESAVV